MCLDFTPGRPNFKIVTLIVYSLYILTSYLDFTLYIRHLSGMTFLFAVPGHLKKDFTCLQRQFRIFRTSESTDRTNNTAL